VKVLQMIGYLSTMGGAERFATALATHLPSDRFEMWVCAPRGGEPEAIEVLERAGVRFVDLGRRSKRDYYRLAGLVQLLREHRFDILHSHMFGSNVWATLLGRACQVPILIAHEHTWSYEGNWTRARIDGEVIGRLTSRFVAVSSADARRMVSIEGVPPAKIQVLPTAYIPSDTSRPVDLRAELGLGPDTLLYGTATVMRPQKALEVLLAAHVHVRRALPGAHLILAGDGDLRPALELRAELLGIRDSTHFLGRRSDVDSILRSLDVGTMSSDFEGLPLFAFECLAARTPLVATAVGGLPDLIQDGREGRLVPRRQPRQLAEAVTDLLRDPGARERVAAAAGEKLHEFTIQKVTARFADLYEDLLANQY
jgi:glycosyltransferase involved in cell wall biosynthesis